MKWSRSMRKVASQIEDSLTELKDEIHDSVQNDGRKVFRTIGWVSAGVTALALGVVVGRELRQRYKFNRRTPYDVYAHAGDQAQDVEFGVGI